MALTDLDVHDMGSDEALMSDMEAPAEVTRVGDFLNDDDETSLGMWVINTGGC